MYETDDLYEYVRYHYPEASDLSIKFYIDELNTKIFKCDAYYCDEELRYDIYEVEEEIEENEDDILVEKQYL